MRFMSGTIAVLIVAAILMVAATWGVTQKIVENDYQRRLAMGQERAGELATFFEAETQKIITIADTFVRQTRRTYLEQYRDNGSAALDSLAIFQNEFVSNLLVIGPDGAILAQSARHATSGSVAQMPYFQAVRDQHHDHPLFTLPDEGRLSGRLTVGLVRRIELDDGSFGGAVLAAINVDEFTDFFSTVDLGLSSSATLVGLDKRIRARSSYGSVGPGQDISGSQLWTRLAERSVGLYRQTSVVDGVTRFYAYRQIIDLPLVVAIGLSEADVIRGAHVVSRPLYIVAASISAAIAILVALLCFAEFSRHRLQAEVATRRTAEEGLEAANTDLAQFAYSASHDLKSPLSSIHGLLDFCVEDLDAGDFGEVRRNVLEASGVASRAARKVESLLRLAKAGNQPVPVETFLAADMVRNIWKDQSANLDKSCRLDLQIEDSMQIVTEKAVMQVILENIIANAIRYRDRNKPETLIRISASHESRETLFVISDNGVGIAQKDHAKVFEMFKRVSDLAGDGLGLALVKKNADRLGATISMQSELGKGTDFILKFEDLSGGKK